jgi:hypothetical protein
MQNDLAFVIPTYRLRDVAQTVEDYDAHFQSHGHSVKMIVLDDSTTVNHDKYFALLEKTRTHNELHYVGPKEKAAFLDIVRQRLRDAEVEPVVAELFRPSYGGNRNYSLVYTLGAKMISADDDMRPYALADETAIVPAEGEVCRGKVVRARAGGYVKRSSDVLGAFLDVLGKPVADAPAKYLRGDHLVDTAMDLETNATKGFHTHNSLLLAPGAVDPRAVVKIAQTFRSGTSDVDALDFVDMFLDDEEQSSLDVLGDLYILQGFRPVITNRNWRMDCGVAGFDNTAGLPPFFPTRLRFEDYIFRLWVQQEGVAAAHVDAAQNHAKSPYMRNPPAAEVFNEEVANFLKRRIKASVTGLDDLGIRFGYDGAVGHDETVAMLDKMRALHGRVTSAGKRSHNPERAGELWRFAATLEKTFYGFELDFFQHNLQRVVQEEVSVIKRSIEIWPTLLEICFFHAARKGLPMLRVQNHTN